ncbi:MAG: hypothetical protein FWH20_05780 [Oscillospiraceae bacterium]|nr:hypothetical protein [Oscillospiraceae bacterium]
MQPINITMFGEFSISYGSNTIAEKDKRSKKMWAALKYLTAFMDRSVTQDELVGVMWGNEAAPNNPGGALKTQLHRLRTTLDKLGFGGVELIESASGTYGFNKSFEYIVDAVLFEEYYKKSLKEDISEKEQINYIKQAFELYKGEYLKSTADEKWVSPRNAYYRSIYLRVVHRLMDTLYRYRQYTELTNICQRASKYESADQEIHIHLIKGLIAVNNREAAKQHYSYVTDMLYNEFGISPNPQLQGLYNEIVSAEMKVEDDLEVIHQMLKEDSVELDNGAFYCEPEFFKSIYRLRLRDTARTGQKTHICLITLKDAKDTADTVNARRGGNSAKPQNSVFVEEMRKLHDCIATSLRKSDVFARYSRSQYVLMLPAAVDETSETVIKRIRGKYRERSDGVMFDIDFKYIMNKGGG